MKLVRSLLGLLGMEELHDEVMSTMVDSLFVRRSSGSGGSGVAPQAEVVAGSEMELLLRQLKKKAEQNERRKKRA